MSASLRLRLIQTEVVGQNVVGQTCEQQVQSREMQSREQFSHFAIPDQQPLRAALNSPRSVAMSVESQLSHLGLQLPEAPRPVAAYIPCVRTGSLLFVSGQLPFAAKQLLATGPVPSETTIEQAQEAGKQCVLNALAIAKAELGSLERIQRVVRLGVFVQSDNGFTQQPQVANGASEFVQLLFGDSGKHARAAIGVNALPLNASVEIEFIFEVA